MEHIVRKQISIDAHPAQVWEALTNPEKTKQYFFNCRVDSDWKKGSPITFKGKAFFIKDIEMHGKIVDIDPGKLLKYTLGNGDGESFSLVTDKLSYGEGLTTLSISDDVGSGKGSETRFRKSAKGWEKVLKGLKKLVEARRKRL